MFYDASGRPAEDGDFELRDGRMILRQGRGIGTSTAFFMDSAPKRGSSRDQVDAARRAWVADKRTAHRRPQPQADARPTNSGTKAGVAQARAARNVRLANAYRG